MKILVVADEESKYIWDHFDPDRFEDIDLVISCGDLKSSYLSFLVTMIRAPLLYVHGNHDGGYDRNPPLGCDSIEDRIVVVGGVRILGLGGSYLYNHGSHQYSEQAMAKRVKQLRRSLKRNGGFDILVTHAPAEGLGDGDDLCHKGFAAFNKLLETYRPSYFLHGHQHLNYSRKTKRVRRSGETTVINGFDHYIFEYKPNIYAPPWPYVLKQSRAARLLGRTARLLRKSHSFHPYD